MLKSSAQENYIDPFQNIQKNDFQKLTLVRILILLRKKLKIKHQNILFDTVYPNLGEGVMIFQENIHP